MAGDWLKLDITTPDKAEVDRIAVALQIKPAEALGRLILVWRWFDQHTTNGNASVTQDFINRVSGLEGFADAMRSVGWLSGENGTVSLPRFDRHNGKTAKKRALTAKRQAAFKKRNANAEVTQSASPREVKRRGTASSSKKPLSTGNGVSKDLGTPTPSLDLAREGWAAYHYAYLARYEAQPLRDAKANSLMKRIVQRLGAETPGVVTFFLTSNRALYVNSKHDLTLLLRDAPALRTEWATGRQGTETEARQGDKTQSNRNAFQGMLDVATTGAAENNR